MKKNSSKIKQGLITEGILGGCICGCLLSILILVLSLGGGALDVKGLYVWILTAFLGGLLAGVVSTMSSWSRIRQKIRILELRYGSRFDGQPLHMLAESRTVYVNDGWLVYHSGRDYRVYARPEIAAVDPYQGGKPKTAGAVLRLNSAAGNAVITYTVSADEDFLAAAREWVNAAPQPAAAVQRPAPAAGKPEPEPLKPEPSAPPQPQQPEQPVHTPAMQPLHQAGHGHKIHPLVWVMLAVILALILAFAGFYSFHETHVPQDYPQSTQSPLGGSSRRA
jgi:hypothetical protein